MKDEWIRYRAVERQALIANRVQAFCLTSGNLRAAQMVEHILAAIEDIAEACIGTGPILYACHPRGVRRLDL